MVGMGVTIVLILAVGGVGVWYWLRIKETSSHEKVEDKTPPRIPQEPIFGEDLINSGDIKVDEIKKTSPPAEEPQSESQSPEETIEEVQEVLLKETEEEEEPVETSPVLEEIDDSGLPKYDPFVTELVRITFKKPVTGSQLAPFVKTAMENAPRGLLRILALEANSNRWFVPDAIGMFSAIAFYIQLASGKASFDQVSLSNLYQLVFLRMEMNLDGTSEMKEMQLLNNHTDQLNALIKDFGVQITLLLRPLEPVSIDDFEKETMLLGLKRRSMTHYEKLGELVLDKNGKRQGNRKGTIELRWLDDRNIAISLNVPLIAPESDPLRLLMTAANAGHEYPVLKRAGGEFELFKDKHGFVLAGMEDSGYWDYEISFAPGDMLFVYTDGVPEATNAQKELYRTDRMVEALNRHASEGCEGLLHEMKEEIQSFVQEAPQFDDITMLALNYYGPEETKTGE